MRKGKRGEAPTSTGSAFNHLLAFVHSRLQLCYGDRYAKMLVKTLSDRTTYSTFKNCGMRITEFGYDKYMTDSLISKLATDNPPQLISVLNQCDSTKLLKAVGNYNIKALVNKINAHIPQGSTFITNTCAYFQLTIPRPVGMTCVNYLAKVVPMDSLLRRIRLNYAFYVDDIGAMPVADLTEVFSRYYSECDFKDCTWPKYANGTLDFDSTHLISTTRDRYWPYLTRELYDCDNDSFTLHAAYTRPYSISELFTKWKYPLDSFMAHVQAYWNSTVRNRIDVDTMKRVQYLFVNEWHLYGSSRLGILQSTTDTIQGVVRSYQHRVSNDTIGGNYFSLDTLRYYKFGKDSTNKQYKGLRRYEGTNHLGNVLVVFTDKRINVCVSDTISYYRADVTNAYDYYPFGAPLRTWNSDTTEKYRFGFNGQEKDNEVSGDGNSNTAEYWQYDGRLGRRWNVDPVIKVWESPYACFANNPICFVDKNGADSADVKITFAPGVDKSVVSEHSLGVLRSLAAKAGLTELKITSTYRDPNEQIETMYNNILKNGTANQYKTYGKKGDQVIDAYVKAKKDNPNATEEEIKAIMKSKAEEVCFISPHSSENYSAINAIDVSYNYPVKWSDETYKKMRSLAKSDSRVARVFGKEEGDAAFHVEIPVIVVASTGTTQTSPAAASNQAHNNNAQNTSTTNTATGNQNSSSQSSTSSNDVSDTFDSVVDFWKDVVYKTKKGIYDFNNWRK